MNYETFQEYVRVKCLYDAIYQDQEGRDILVIPLLNAYAMVHRAPRPWVGLEQSDMPDGEDPMFDHKYFIAGMVYADKVLKEKNT
jgi:hypothetical protein